MTEPVCVLFGIASHHGYECEAVEDRKEQDFASGEPKLGFAVVFDREHVNDS